MNRISDSISRRAAIDALWKALYEYEDKTEKQFLESNELDVGDWFLHRIFVQNMSDIDRQTILDLPSTEPEHGHWRKMPMACYGGGTITEYQCSVCEENQIATSSFCPNCGAEMERSER